MTTQRPEVMTVSSSEHVSLARQMVKRWAVELGFSLVEQTKLVTATSELARNIVVYAGEGTVRVEAIDDGLRRGLRIIFEDHGPGIPDIELALKNGYTTGTGLGLGLSGSRRLVDDFEIVSKVGEGTRVTVTRWK
jgi:serine/threonine-protein kinase RsbT